MFLYKLIEKIFSKKSKKESKITQRQKELLDQYDQGNIIQVGNDVDNKDFLKSENKKEYLNKFKNEESENKPIKDNTKLEEEISKLIKEQPKLKVKIYLRILLKKFKGNLNQEKTRELIKKSLNKK